MTDFTGIFENGYSIIDFSNTRCIRLIQDQIKLLFKSDPIEFHQKEMEDEQRLNLIKQAQDRLTETDIVKNLLSDNSECIKSLIGPDVDIQTGLYLRVSRPNIEGDLIDWHRDTFYGNSHWELNFWLPIFPLEEGAGLMLAEGSHLISPNNVHYIQDKNLFRQQVTKGSVASQLGFQYAPKSEEAITHMDMSTVRLIRPKVGQAVLFFGHIVHRAQNFSAKTRVSIDVRIKHMLAPTSTKAGYYQPLFRSEITRCIEKMNLIEKGVFCGN